jgi:hypothetical protein
MTREASYLATVGSLVTLILMLNIQLITTEAEEEAEYMPRMFYVTTKDLSRLIETVNRDDFMKNASLAVSQLQAMQQRAAAEIREAKIKYKKTFGDLILEKPYFQDYGSLFKIVKLYVSRKRYQKLYRDFDY